MARQNKLKKTGGLKTNGGLMNKIFKVYMLLMFISCMVLLIVFGIRFSSVYNSQAKSHMNDVTASTETGIEERISQIDQLSVSILINNSVQKNLKSINHDVDWLERELNVLGVPLSDIILMYQEDNSNLGVYTINEIEKKFN